MCQQIFVIGIEAKTLLPISTSQPETSKYRDAVLRNGFERRLPVSHYYKGDNFGQSEGVGKAALGPGYNM